MSSADKSLVEALSETAPMPDLALAPPQAQAERLRLPWTSRVVDTVSTYLPVLLMAVLALGTWWLVKNTPVLDNERQVAPPRHEPDYTMRQFMVQRFAAGGALKVQIEGDELRHYPDTDTLEIDNPRIRATGPDGRITRASAKHALSNGDGSEVQLSGGARVVREARDDDEALEFRGEFLHAFLATERVRSHLPVTVTQGATEIRADGMSYDNLSRIVEFKGRVRAVLSPAANRKSP
ncbi:MAG TPA: LPS export ABC transporter periplasmic protein LptC [Burkholderiaceae bacterium]|nr:LPS export ABC transporter periplasmic protein LptC [Burkholderiaceae bacterium]